MVIFHIYVSLPEGIYIYIYIYIYVESFPPGEETALTAICHQYVPLPKWLHYQKSSLERPPRFPLQVKRVRGRLTIFFDGFEGRDVLPCHVRVTGV